MKDIECYIYIYEVYHKSMQSDDEGYLIWRAVLGFDFNDDDECPSYFIQLNITLTMQGSLCLIW